MAIAPMSSRIQFYPGTSEPFRSIVADTQNFITDLSPRINRFVLGHRWRNLAVNNLLQIPDVRDDIAVNDPDFKLAEGLCAISHVKGRSFFAVAEYLDGEQIPLSFVRKNTAHEICHAVGLAIYAPYALHDDPAFIKAYEKDRPLAQLTERMAQIYADNPEVDIDLEYLAYQLDEEKGRKEVWANHMVHYLLGEPYYKVSPENFRNTMDEVGTHAARFQLLPRERIHDIFNKAMHHTIQIPPSILEC